MNDRWRAAPGPADQPDPVVADALRSLVAPPHGYGFWAELDDRLIAEPVAPTMAVPVVGPPPAPPPPPPPPLAEVVPMPASGPHRRRWLAAVAAVLVVALGIAALVRTTSTDDVKTSAAATAVPTGPVTSAPATTAPPTTVTPATVATTVKAPTTTVRPTTTAAPSFSISPEGLGPLRLGMTHEQAMATGAVGRFEDPLDTGGQCGHASPAGSYRLEDFTALFLDGRLARFYVGNSRIRTPQGIGNGSPVVKLSSIPGARVESPHPYDDPVNPTRKNIDITTGNAGYQFTIENGTVVEWSVGTKEGLSLIEGCA